LACDAHERVRGEADRNTQVILRALCGECLSALASVWTHSEIRAADALAKAPCLPLIAGNKKQGSDVRAIAGQAACLI